MSLKVYSGLDGKTVELQESTHKYTYYLKDCKRFAHHSVTEVVSGKLNFAALSEPLQRKIRDGTVKHRELSFYAQAGVLPVHLPHFTGMRDLFRENQDLNLKYFKSEVPFVAVYKGGKHDISVGGTPDLWDTEKNIIIEYKSVCYDERWFENYKLQTQAYLFYLKAHKAYLVYADRYFEIKKSNEDARIFEMKLQNLDFNKYVIPQSECIIHWDEKTYNLGKKTSDLKEELEDFIFSGVSLKSKAYLEKKKERAKYQTRLAKEARRIVDELGGNQLIFITKDELDGVKITPYRTLDKKTNEIKTQVKSKFFKEEDMDEFRGY